ncbi:MAG: hypothetical protein JNK75_15225 [Betaproteobacteria bacterium]|nr:hypothetical protein [Betaproteobacteria bacterium]
MGKILLTLILAVIALLTFKSLLGKSRPPPPADRGRTGMAERMVRCSRCGVHLPESESMQRDGETLCRTPEQCLRRENA